MINGYNGSTVSTDEPYLLCQLHQYCSHCSDCVAVENRPKFGSGIHTGNMLQLLVPCSAEDQGRRGQPSGWCGTEPQPLAAGTRRHTALSPSSKALVCILASQEIAKQVAGKGGEGHGDHAAGGQRRGCPDPGDLGTAYLTSLQRKSRQHGNVRRLWH